MKPSQLLDKSRILVGIDGSTTKGALLRRLAALALAGREEALDAAVADLLAREAKMSTGIGQGVAIPHTRSARVDRPSAALAVSRDGIDFQAVDGEPVHIVFAFVTPESDPAIHIKTLGETAAFFADEAAREAIRSAETVEEVLAALGRHGG